MCLSVAAAGNLSSSSIYSTSDTTPYQNRYSDLTDQVARPHLPIQCPGNLSMSASHCYSKRTEIHLAEKFQLCLPPSTQM